MSTPLWTELGLFALCLVGMSWASVWLSNALERLGALLGFSGGLLGVATALGADAPEICSAFTAIIGQHHEVGMGVVLGSNIFNLAGLLGLSALVAGRVPIGRSGLWLNGGVGMAVSAVAVAMLLHWIPVRASLVLLIAMVVPYVAILAMDPARIARLPLHIRTRRFLERAVGHAHRDARKRNEHRAGTARDVIVLAVSLGIIIATSIGAVDSAVALAAHWNISHAIVGMLVLSPLTSVPNTIAAVQLARDGHGPAVVSEALNSNTLNILVGLCLPALLIGFARPTPLVVIAAFWLLAMKGLALGLASHRHGLHRFGGALLLVVYAGFIVLVAGWS